MNRIITYKPNPNMTRIMDCMDLDLNRNAKVNLQELTMELIRKSNGSQNEKLFLEQQLNNCSKIPGACSAEQYLNDFDSIICSSTAAFNKVVCAISEFFTGPLCPESSAANISSRTSDSIDGNDFFVIGAGSLVLMIGMALIIKHIFMDSKHCQQKPKLHSEDLLNSTESGIEGNDNL
jgi:hypothetical protein